MADRIIAQADLSGIRNCLRELGEYIDTTNSNVITVGKNVDALTADFHDFAQARRLSATAPSAVTAPSPSSIRAEERRGMLHSSPALITIFRNVKNG